MSARERLEPALMLYLMIAWRVPFLMLMGRTCPDLPCEVVFDPEEWQTAYSVGKRQTPPPKPPSLGEMMALVAGFGGFGWDASMMSAWPQGALDRGLLQRVRDFAIAAQVMSEMHNLSSA